VLPRQCDAVQLPSGIEVDRLAEDVLDLGAREADVIEDAILLIEQCRNLPSCAPVAEQSLEAAERGAAAEDFRLIQYIVSHLDHLGMEESSLCADI